MNKVLIFISVIAILILQLVNVVYSQSINYNNWETVIFDDFSYQNVNQLKQNWKIGYPYDDANGNPVLVEHSYWDDDPNNPTTFAGYASEKSLSFIKNSANETILRIEATTKYGDLQVARPDGNGYDIFKYATGVLTNKNYIDYNHYPNYNEKGTLNGLFEIRCKIPPNTAFTPAFWLFGAEGGYEEIDIFEVGYHDYEKNRIMCTIQNINFPSTNKVNCSSFYELLDGKKFSDEYHTYSLIWSPTHLYWYVDGIEILSTKNPYPGHGRLNTAQIVVNLGVWNQQGLDNDVYFDVDYVKLYKEKRNSPIFNNHPRNVSAEICYSDSRNAYFYVANDGKIFNTFENSWSGPNSYWESNQVTTNQVVNSKSEIEWSESRQCLFYIGDDKRLYNIFWNTWSSSSPFWDIGVVDGSFPANVNSNIIWSESRQCLFYIDNNNKINCIYWDTWTNPASPKWMHEIINSDFPANASRELDWSENRQALFYIGLDNKIYNIFWNTWSTATPYWDFGPITTISTVDASDQMTWSENRNALFYKGTDNKIYNIFWNTWSTATPYWDYGLIDINYEFDTHSDGKFFCEAFCKTSLIWNNEFNELTYIGSDDKFYSLYYDTFHQVWQLRCLKWQAIPATIDGININHPYLGPTDINKNYTINGNRMCYRNRDNSLSFFELYKIKNFVDYTQDECGQTFYEENNLFRNYNDLDTSMNLNLDANFIIYPNPSTDNHLIIETAKPYSINDIRLIDIYGRNIPLKYIIDQNKIICDVKLMPDGIYYLLINNDLKIIPNKIIIKH